MLGRVVEERQEDVDVVADLGCRFGPFDAELGRERFRRGLGVGFVLRVVDLGQRLLRGRVDRFRQSREDVSELVDVMPTSA